MNTLNRALKVNSHRGVILRGEYAYFPRFQITQRFNDLIILYKSRNWSEEQKETHDLIKSLHGGGLGYRKIAQYLNEKGIKTVTGRSGEEIMSMQFSKDAKKD